jgi:aminopeptidase YwaD
LTLSIRRLIGFLAIAILPVAIACGGSSDSADTPADVSQQPTATAVAPEPTSTAVPTATAIPEPSATPTAEPVRSILDEGPLKDRVVSFSDEAWNFLVDLSENHSPRETATDEEAEAATFILDRFVDIGYQAGLQLFDFQLVDDEVEALTLTMDAPPAVPGMPLSRSIEGIVTGPLIDVGLALPGDFSVDSLVGKVAFIQRGEVTFEEKVIRVQEAGAIAAIIYNNLPGPFRGSMITESTIPAVTASQETGALLSELMAAGEVEVTVSVVIETFSSRNVIAEKPGTDPEAGTVVIGAHIDTVAGVQGANDNGSGVAVLMTLAREIFESSFPFDLQIVAFGSEEAGLRGSRFYVASLSGEEQDDLVAMLNFDVPGGGDFVELQGDPGMSLRVRNYGDVNGIRVIRGNLDTGGSDHESFEAHDVPVLFFFGNDISRMHTTDDTTDFVNRELLGTTVALGRFALQDIAAGQ